MWTSGQSPLNLSSSSNGTFDVCLGWLGGQMGFCVWSTEPSLDFHFRSLVFFQSASLKKSPPAFLCLVHLSQSTFFSYPFSDVLCPELCAYSWHSKSMDWLRAASKLTLWALPSASLVPVSGLVFSLQVNNVMAPPPPKNKTKQKDKTWIASYCLKDKI